MAKIKFRNGEVFPLQKLCNYYTNPINLDKQNKKTGLIGWFILAAYIILFDIYAIKTKNVETLTRSFWRLSEGKLTKFPVFIAWGVITAHLMLEKQVRKKIYS